MGRTIPSATQLVFDQISEVRQLYLALRRADQLIMDSFFDAVMNHRAEIANAANLLPLEAMLLVILLEERKTAHREREQLYTEMQELRRQMMLLQDPAP